MKNRFDFSLCALIQIIIASLICFFTVRGNGDIVSFLFDLSFIVLFLYALLNFHVDKKTVYLLILVAFCFMNVILNCFFEGASLSFNSLKKVIMFSAFLIFMNLATDNNEIISAKVIATIKILPLLSGVYLILSYYYMGNTASMGGYIYLNFTNPNFAAMWLLHFFLYGCLFVIDAVEKRKIRLLFIPVLFVIWNLILQTGCRSCMIGCVFFFVMFALGLIKKRVNKRVVFLIALFPFIYSILYLMLVGTPWFLQTFDFFVAEGKSLVSREGIWLNAFEKYARYPVIGNYFGISYGTGQAQLHNTHIDVLCSYGLLPMILFVKNLYENMQAINNQSQSLYQWASFSAFCSVIVMGSFEAAMVSGAMGLNLLSVGFLILANNSLENRSNNNRFVKY